MTIHKIKWDPNFRTKFTGSVPPPSDLIPPGVPYGYRFHPVRLEAFRVFRELRPRAFIFEELEDVSPFHYDHIVKFTFKLYVKVFEEKRTAFNSRGELFYSPSIEEVKRGFEFDVYLDEFSQYEPRLERISFHNLTQSFPDDIVLPQSRRYR